MNYRNTGARSIGAAPERIQIRTARPAARAWTAGPTSVRKKGAKDSKHDTRHRFASLGPIAELLFLAITGTACAYAAACYMGLEPGISLGLVCAGVILGVYAVNRFTDTTEDFANDTSRLMFFAARKGIMVLAVAALGTAVLVLVARELLTAYAVFVVAAGLAYSFRLIPWYRRGEGVVFVRLKEVPLLKNILVSLLWGLSVFAVPRLFAEGKLSLGELMPVAPLIAALTVSTLNSTMFNDIMDRTGDLLAGNLTLPVLLGNRKTAQLLVGIDAAWLGVVLLLAATGTIGAAQAAFIAVVTLYPLTYLAAYRSGRFGRGAMTLVAEGDLPLFAAGLLLLASLG